MYVCINIHHHIYQSSHEFWVLSVIPVRNDNLLDDPGVITPTHSMVDCLISEQLTGGLMFLRFMVMLSLEPFSPEE